MLINILTLFPEYFATNIATSMLKRASDAGIVQFRIINIREYATDKHKVTDDRPFGGGPGMVLKVEPIDRALTAVRTLIPQGARHAVILLSAKGKMYTQSTAREYAKLDVLTVLCGHYEGVDERVAEHLVDAEVRIGDYVLTGGEPAAAVLADSVVRLLPGALGNEHSTVGESHDVPGQLGYPQYTRPASYRGWEVPELLLSGDHKKIATWRNDLKQG